MFVLTLFSQTEKTPLEEAVEGEDPEIVRLLMKAEAQAKAKVSLRTRQMRSL